MLSCMRGFSEEMYYGIPAVCTSGTIFESALYKNKSCVQVDRYMVFKLTHDAVYFKF